MKSSSKLAFTLIELLVVISIIGILAALAIPAVAGALVKGQMTGTLSNARQLQLATFNISLENEAAGVAGAWPSVSNSVTVTKWLESLTNGLTMADLRKMLSAPGVVTPSGNDPSIFTATTIAFNAYAVGDVEEGSAIFLTTRNWDATSPGTFPVEAIPYGNKGAIVMRKGGDGQVFQARFITNSTNVGILSNQPPKVN